MSTSIFTKINLGFFENLFTGYTKIPDSKTKSTILRNRDYWCEIMLLIGDQIFAIINK